MKKYNKLIKKFLAISMTAVCSISVLYTGFSEVSASAEDQYSVMSPLGYTAIDTIEQAPRLDTLDGKRIAIVGRSFNATITQAVLKELILKDYPTATVYTVDDLGCGGIFSVFNQSNQSKEFQQRLKDYKIDAVISGNCGCGLCTVKESGSSIAAEYIGIPTVTVGATSFVSEIHSTGTNRGVPVLRTVEYPGAFSADSISELRQKSRDIIYPGVINALTTQITDEEIASFSNEGYRAYDDTVVTGTYDMIQTYYRMNGWSDGLPVNLPTAEKVEEYLKYTPYDGEDILGIYPLAYREVRVYTVAVNAIMAGCPPEYMPLCIAFVKSMDDPEWRRTLASTHGWTPYAWINGPIARQLGIECGEGMMNDENNKKLARFIEFAMCNLGGYYIKENRMGTFGYLTPWVFSEDEKSCLEIGWQPYHVSQGKNINSNTLTSASCLYWGNDLTPATDDAEQIKNVIAFDITEKQQNGLGNTNPQVWRTMYITPDTAKDLSGKYTSKSDFEDALIETARRPLWLRTYANYWANTGSYQYTRRTIEEHYNMLESDEAEQAEMTSVPEWYAPLFPDKKEIMTMATLSKGQTPILVAGENNGNKIQTMPGGGYATIDIELPYNWDSLMAEKGYQPLSSFYLEEPDVNTEPVSVKNILSDGTYRVMPAKEQVTSEGRIFAQKGIVTYWNGSSAIDVADTGKLADIVESIGTSSTFTVKNGIITDYVIRPASASYSSVKDISALTGDVFTGADVTFAVNMTKSSALGGVTPTGTSIIMSQSVDKFKADLGGDIVFAQGNTPNFLTYDGEYFTINHNATPNSKVKIGVLNNDKTYRTFEFVFNKNGTYTINYTDSESITIIMNGIDVAYLARLQKWLLGQKVDGTDLDFDGNGIIDVFDMIQARQTFIKK